MWAALVRIYSLVWVVVVRSVVVVWVVVVLVGSGTGAGAFSARTTSSLKVGSGGTGGKAESEAAAEESSVARVGAAWKARRGLQDSREQGQQMNVGLVMLFCSYSKISATVGRASRHT